MNKKIILLILCAAACLFSACAKQEGDTRATAFDIFGITEKEPTEENVKEIVFEDQFTWERKNFIMEGEPESVTTAFDGSRVTTLRDAFGNVTHQRYFRGHPRLKSILIVSREDGEPEIYLYGRDKGSVVRMTGETAQQGLMLPADELADRAGIRQAVGKNAFDSPGLRSSLPVKNPAVANPSEKEDYGVYESEYPQTASTDAQTPPENERGNPQITQNDPQKRNPEEDEEDD